MNRVVRGNRGVTLIALVLTIVVLIILAMITMAVLTGENGLIIRAIGARDETRAAAEREAALLGEMEGMIDDWLSGNRSGGDDGDGNENGEDGPLVPLSGPGSEIKAGETAIGGNKIYIDAEGSRAVIPEGFRISDVVGEYIIQEGMVVIAPDQSEFVWVPVPFPVLEVSATRTEAQIVTDINAQITQGRFPMAIRRTGSSNFRGVMYTFGSGTGGTAVTITPVQHSTTATREPDIVTDATNGDASTTGVAEIRNILGSSSAWATLQNEWRTHLQNEFNSMMTSVIEYGGFYIGRFHTSIRTGTENNAIVQSRQNVQPMHSVNWYGLYQRQREWSTRNNITSATSAMIYGSQWDQVLIWMRNIDNPNVAGAKFIRNSTGKGWFDNNSDDIRQPTGTLPAAKVRNIFDMAGNVWDWTQTVLATANRANRGGSLYDTAANFPVSSRVNGGPILSNTYVGSRLQLYIALDSE